MHKKCFAPKDIDIDIEATTVQIFIHMIQHKVVGGGFKRRFDSGLCHGNPVTVATPEMVV